MAPHCISCPECHVRHDADDIRVDGTDDDTHVWRFVTAYNGDVMNVRDAKAEVLEIEFPCGHTGVALHA